MAEVSALQSLAEIELALAICKVLYVAITMVALLWQEIRGVGLWSPESE